MLIKLRISTHFYNGFFVQRNYFNIAPFAQWFGVVRPSTLLHRWVQNFFWHFWIDSLKLWKSVTQKIQIRPLTGVTGQNLFYHRPKNDHFRAILKPVWKNRMFLTGPQGAPTWLHGPTLLESCKIHVPVTHHMQNGQETWFTEELSIRVWAAYKPDRSSRLGYPCVRGRGRWTANFNTETNFLGHFYGFKQYNIYYFNAK